MNKGVAMNWALVALTVLGVVSVCFGASNRKDTVEMAEYSEQARTTKVEWVRAQALVHLAELRDKVPGQDLDALATYASAGKWARIALLKEKKGSKGYAVATACLVVVKRHGMGGK